MAISAQKFCTRIVAGQSKAVTGIEVPPHVIDALGAGQRPRLKIRLNSYEYISSVGKMDGKYPSGEGRLARGGINR